MVTRGDRLKSMAAVVLDEGAGRSIVSDIEEVMRAIEALHRAGYAVVLLPHGTSVQVTKRRRWWRRERSA